MRNQFTSTLCIWVGIGVVGMLGCGDDTSAGSGKKGQLGDATNIGTVDGQDSDAEPDVVSTVDVTVSQDITVESDLGTGGSQPGEAGYPCTSGNECFSGICANGPDGKVCAASCGSDGICPDGWVCSQVQTLPDLIFVCVYAMQNLCKPCLTNADCLGVYGEPPGQCVGAQNGDGSFCSYGCKSSTQCPSGSSCGESATQAGQWCFPETGECACEPQWEGASTGCKLTNDFGTCVGTKTCKSGQFTQCSAPLPSVEICNGNDDNCNGVTDEDTDGAPCTTVNEVGTCTGLSTCLGGKSICGAAVAIVELCDGLDNDCDGDVDEGFVDTDQDLVADCVDDDKDGDGLINANDNCPDVANPDQADLDLDGKGNDCDIDADGDLTENTKDCAPLDGSVHPMATELCNGKDDDCDGQADDGFSDLDADGMADCVDADDDGDLVADTVDNCPNLPNPSQADLDSDGLGNGCDSDSDGDGDSDITDCQPLNTAVHSKAVELCDGVDNNCNKVIDEGFSDLDQDGVANCIDDDDDGDGITDTADNCPTIANTDQADLDGDGKGDACENDTDGDGDPDLVDCQPGNPAVHHAAAEQCNGLDDNCNGIVDEGFADTDADLIANCLDPDDDNDNVPDGLDNCPLVANPNQQNFDDDTHGDVCDDDDDGDSDPDVLDCAPLDPTVFHGAIEVCNGKDDNCNGVIDDPNSPGCQPYFYDQDNDQFGIAGATQCLCGPKAPFSADQPGDCNDQNAQIFPNANELCNGKDDNCDGTVDEQGAIGCIALYVDVDLDGWGDDETVCLCKPQPGYVTKPGDCNDNDAKISPQGSETCNLMDDDCDGVIDDSGAVGCQKYYLDADKDVVGLSSDSLCLCEPLDNYTAVVAGDCNDNAATVHPTSIEVCDGLDNNCNGQIDEGVKTTYYIDVDKDGYGASYNTKEACQTPQGYADLGGDCNDFNPTISPGQNELCDKTDNNCNGLLDEGLPQVKVYVDLDGDGFGAKGTSGSFSCLLDSDSDGTGDTAPVGFSVVATDCNDSASTVYPTAPELCDGVLNDCLATVADFQCPSVCEGAWPAPLGVTSGHMIAAQLDATNALELVAQGAGSVRMLDHMGATKWSSAAAVQYSHPILAAMNTDDYLDVVLIETGAVRVLSGTDGTELESYETFSTGWRPGAVFDLDNDGITDIVTSGEVKFTIILRNGLGGAKAIFDVAPPTGAYFSADTPGIWDVDGDGIAEILMGTGYSTCNTPNSPACNGMMVIVNGATGTVSYDPNTNFVVPDALNAYSGGPSPLVADVDGDGNTEILQWFGNQVSGAKLLGWNLDGTSKTLPSWIVGSDPKLAPIDENGVLVTDNSLRTVGGGVVDLDGDGKYETVRVDGNGLSIYRGKTMMNGFPVKVAGSEPLLTDINRDGRLDILYVGSENAALNCYTLGEGTYSDAQWLTSGHSDPFTTSRYRTGAFDPFEPNHRTDKPFDPVTSTQPVQDSRAFPFLGLLDKYNSANGWSRSLRGIVGHYGDRDYYHASGKQIFVTLNTVKNLVNLDLYVHMYKQSGAKWQYLATWSSTGSGNESIQCHTSSPCPDVANTNVTKTFIIEVRPKNMEVDYGPWPYDLRIVWGAK